MVTVACGMAGGVICAKCGDLILRTPTEIPVCEKCKEKTDLAWFQCDKGWFGVEIKYHKRVYEFISRTEFERNPMYCHKNSITLLESMNWAEGIGIPYEISTVMPDVVAEQLQRVAVMNERLAQVRRETEALRNGLSAVLVKKEPSHRIELIREAVDKLTKQYQARAKPIETECYYLLRNIAKYIVEQADGQRDPEAR